MPETETFLLDIKASSSLSFNDWNIRVPLYCLIFIYSLIIRQELRSKIQLPKSIDNQKFL
jgi:hypothetical protein